MSVAKTTEQLAQAAYAAYCKKAVQIDEEGLAGHAPTWAELDHGTRDCWIAVSTQMVAQIATLRGHPFAVEGTMP